VCATSVTGRATLLGSVLREVVVEGEEDHMVEVVAEGEDVEEASAAGDAVVETAAVEEVWMERRAITVTRPAILPVTALKPLRPAMSAGRLDTYHVNVSVMNVDVTCVVRLATSLRTVQRERRKNASATRAEVSAISPESVLKVAPTTAAERK